MNPRRGYVPQLILPLVFILAGCKGDSSSTTQPPEGQPLVVFDGWASIGKNPAGYTVAYGYGKNIGKADATNVQCYPCVNGTHWYGLGPVSPGTLQPGATGTFTWTGLNGPNAPTFAWDGQK